MKKNNDSELKGMPVICINNKPVKGAGNTSLSYLKEGSIYTIVEICIDSFGAIGYVLKEVEPYEGGYYAACRFIPLCGSKAIIKGLENAFERVDRRKEADEILNKVFKAKTRKK